MVAPGLMQTLIHFLFPWFCWDSPQPSSARASGSLQGDPTGSLGSGGLTPTSSTFPAELHSTAWLRFFTLD